MADLRTRISKLRLYLSNLGFDENRILKRVFERSSDEDFKKFYQMYFGHYLPFEILSNLFDLRKKYGFKEFKKYLSRIDRDMLSRFPEFKFVDDDIIDMAIKLGVDLGDLEQVLGGSNNNFERVGE